jgi:HK97 gp10 family phage protein
MNRVYTDTRNLNRLIDRIPANKRQLVKAVAFQVEALAKMKAPVDTGALRNSIYTSIRDNNNPPTEATETLPTPDNDVTAFVGPSVEYGIYQELGTHLTQAQPYLLPALREIERQLENHARIIVNG